MSLRPFPSRLVPSWTEFKSDPVGPVAAAAAALAPSTAKKTAAKKGAGKRDSAPAATATSTSTSTAQTQSPERWIDYLNNLPVRKREALMRVTASELGAELEKMPGVTHDKIAPILQGELLRCSCGEWLPAGERFREHVLNTHARALGVVSMLATPDGRRRCVDYVACCYCASPVFFKFHVIHDKLGEAYACQQCTEKLPDPRVTRVTPSKPLSEVRLAFS